MQGFDCSVIYCHYFSKHGIEHTNMPWSYASFTRSVISKYSSLNSSMPHISGFPPWICVLPLSFLLLHWPSDICMPLALASHSLVSFSLFDLFSSSHRLCTAAQYYKATAQSHEWGLRIYDKDHCPNAQEMASNENSPGVCVEIPVLTLKVCSCCPPCHVMWLFTGSWTRR